MHYYCCNEGPPCRPFDPDLYEDEGKEDKILDEEGRASLKLKVVIATSITVCYHSKL